MNFYTNCYLPTYKKEIKINKLTFGDYLQLNLHIKESDYIAINNMFDVICEKSLGSIENVSNLDKFFVLIQLKNNFLSPVLRLSGKNEEGKNATYEVVLKDILKNCKKYNNSSFKLPKSLYYIDSSDILNETSKTIEEIKQHISNNKISMFDIPDIIKNIPNVYLNCFDNTLFYFSKLLYSTDLKNLYRKVIFLKKNLNFSLSEIYDLSPKELDIFLNTK
jgi:hypothetical protein